MEVGIERSRVSDKSQTRSRSSFLPARSATSLPGFDLRVVSCPSCLLVWEALILPSWRVQFQRGALHVRTILYKMVVKFSSIVLALPPRRQQMHSSQFFIRFLEEINALLALTFLQMFGEAEDVSASEFLHGIRLREHFRALNKNSTGPAF
jgi:hypothetical protein